MRAFIEVAGLVAASVVTADAIDRSQPGRAVASGIIAVGFVLLIVL